MATRPPSVQPIMPGRRAVVRAAALHPKGKTAARGYDADWRKMSDYIIKTQPVCCFSGVSKVCTHLTELGDHILPISKGGARLDPANVRPMCKACHARVTGNFRATGNNDLPRRHRIEGK